LLLRATPEQQYCTCGGPGTELLGLAKYYLDRAEGGKHEQIEVRIDSIDRVPEWIENVSWIKAEIAKAYTKQFGKRRDWPALFDVYPFTLDFSDLEGFGNLPSLFRSDIHCARRSQRAAKKITFSTRRDERVYSRKCAFHALLISSASYTECALYLARANDGQTAGPPN